MKVGALIIGVLYLIIGLILGLAFTVAAVLFKPEDFEEMDDVDKISDDKVQSLFLKNAEQHWRQKELKNEIELPSFDTTSWGRTLLW